MKARFSVVIPLFNEEQNIPRLFESLRSLVASLSERFDTRLILIDDGSSDQTVERAKSLAGTLPLRVIGHPRNRGPGAAFRMAFEDLASSGPDDWVLTLEGDNTSRLELVEKMIVRSREGFDVVFASPYLYGGAILNTSFLRVFLSAGANLFVKEFLGLRGIVTVSSFFRLYRASTLLKLQTVYGAGILEFDGFECMLEMTVKLVQIQATISEIAMVLDTHARAGKSKMKIGRSILGYVRVGRSSGKWQAAAREK